MMKRDGHLTSLWQDEKDFTGAGAIDHAKEYDVLIVGGGITGLTTGLLLQRKGLQCLLAEAHTIGFGTTLGTSAHINNFFDSSYSEVIKNFGKEDAALLYKGANDAITLIKDLIAANNIQCGFANRTAYIFSVEEEQDKKLEEIVEGGKETGLPIDYSNDSAFPIPYLKLAITDGQAQFNPAPYILGLAAAFEKAGGTIVQQCRVTAVTGGTIIQASSTGGRILAKNIVYATHIPPGVNLLHFRCAPYRSYVMAVTLANNQYPEALGYDLADPYHYYRSQEVNGKKYLLVGGEDHKTGHEDHTELSFKKLESHTRAFFEVDQVAYKWSSQYFEPVDGLPYIGNLPGNDANVYTATGFGGNGITYGTLSGILLSSLIADGDSEYKKLFDPNRLKPMAGFQQFVKEGTDVVKTFVSGKLSPEKIKALADFAAGEGRIVKYEGETIGLYKDEQHNIHAVNPSCPHIGCNVSWNSAEKTWDCPCHGSRFLYTGEMICGPATHDLKKMFIE